MPFVIVIRIYPTLKHKIQFLAMQCFITALIITHKDVLAKVCLFTIEYAFCNRHIVVHIVLRITAIKLLRLQIFRITQVISNTILEIF